MHQELPAATAIPAKRSARQLEVCITVDDLPIHGRPHPMLSRRQICELFIEGFRTFDVHPVTGFVIGGMAERSLLTRVLQHNAGSMLRPLVEPILKMNNIDSGKYLSRLHKVSESNKEILQDWLAAGHTVGNHTYWHTNLSESDSNVFTNSIATNEKLLQSFAGSKQTMFRYPHLNEGATRETRDTVRKYLQVNNYKNATVTIDFSDWAWNRSYIRLLGSKITPQKLDKLTEKYLEMAELALKSSALTARKLFGRDIKHILLLHFGAFTAITLEALLAHYRALGVKFISLEEALSDPVYENVPDVVLPRGRPFLGQWKVANNESPCLIDRTVVDADW